MGSKAESITVKATVHAPVAEVWKKWTTPDDIRQWCSASDDWHVPAATNDLRVGGKFVTRMEARDGSFGFDFGGDYREVAHESSLHYVMEDGREVRVLFQKDGDTTHITETFDAESENPVEMQRAGWQAILDNFKKFAESR
ncbi:MAG: SRPBCC family protein [Flavobacteriales bacterium]|nr:SRPBCC family protein [Flavobacteriales bacterium]